MKDALEVRTALEQYYVRELAKELDAHPKGRSAGATGKRNTEDERESQSEKSSARSQSQGRTCATQSMVAGEQPTRSTGRPRRSILDGSILTVLARLARLKLVLASVRALWRYTLVFGIAGSICAICMAFGGYMMSNPALWGSKFVSLLRSGMASVDV